MWRAHSHPQRPNVWNLMPPSPWYVFTKVSHLPYIHPPYCGYRNLPVFLWVDVIFAMFWGLPFTPPLVTVVSMKVCTVHERPFGFRFQDHYTLKKNDPSLEKFQPLESMYLFLSQKLGDFPAIHCHVCCWGYTKNAWISKHQAFCLKKHHPLV